MTQWEREYAGKSYTTIEILNRASPNDIFANKCNERRKCLVSRMDYRQLANEQGNASRRDTFKLADSRLEPLNFTSTINFLIDMVTMSIIQAASVALKACASNRLFFWTLHKKTGSQILNCFLMVIVSSCPGHITSVNDPVFTWCIC